MRFELYILLHIVVAVFALLCISRILGVLLGWALSKATRVQISVHRVTFISLRDVRVVTKSATVHITHISLISKLFSSSMRMCGVLIGDVSVLVNLPEKVALHRTPSTHSIESTPPPPRPPKSAGLPSAIKYLIQSIHVRVSSVKVSATSSNLSLSLTLSTGADLVSIPNPEDRSLSSHIGVGHVGVKVRREELTYLNLTFGVKFNLLFNDSFAKVNSLKVTVDTISVAVYEEILPLLRELRPPARSTPSLRSRVSPLQTLPKILEMVPEDREIAVEKLSFSLSDINQTRNISFNLRSLAEKGGHDQQGLVEKLSVTETNIYINNTNFLSVSSATISSLKVTGLKSDSVSVSVTSHIDTIQVQWFNTELIPWISRLQESAAATPHHLSKKAQPSPEQKSTLPVIGPASVLFTSTTTLSDVKVKLYEDNVGRRKLISYLLPSVRVIISKGGFGTRLGLECKRMLLRLPLPGKMKRRLRDNLKRVNDCHLWGQIIDLKSLTLRVQQSERVRKLEVDVQNCILEWNYLFSNLIMELLPQFYNLLSQRQQTSRAGPLKPGKQAAKPFDVDLNVGKLNVFLVHDDPGEMAALLHVDKAKFCKSGGSKSGTVDGCYLHTILHKEDSLYMCNIELSESDKLLHVATINVTQAERSVTGVVTTVTAYWDPSAHRVLERCITRMRDSIICILDLLFRNMGREEKRVERSQSVDSVHLSISRAVINLQTTPTNTIQIHLSPCVVRVVESLLKIKIEDQLLLVFDNHRIFEINEVRIEQLYRDEEVLALRREIPEFSESNRAWFVYAKQLLVCFPHNYGRDPTNANYPTFAMAWDEAINCFKMLKALHRAPRLASDGEALYADCVVQIGQVKVDFEDYQFDKTILENYRLMSLVHQHTDGGDEEEEGDLTPLPGVSENSTAEDTFYDRFKEAKKFYNVSEELARFCLEDVTLTVLADESLNGHERVVEMINTLDDGTEVPSDLRFTTLWGRRVSGSAGIMQFKLRDFPTELWKFTNMHLKGVVCGAEAVSPNHAIRKTRVLLKKPWKNFELARGMNSLKFFYDLTIDVEDFDLGWGPCLEPSYQFYGQAMDKITKRSRDPSPILPFWDKCRNLLRGSLTINSDRFCMKLLSERDPLNSSEYLSICADDFHFKWTNGRLHFQGDTVIKNNTESKYGECQFVTLPKLSLTIDMIWTVLGDNPDDHWNTAVPYDPRFVKLSDPSETWDSYRYFRSTHLDLRIGLLFEEGQGHPQIHLYSNTLKWLDSWASIMATVSRPVFKGRLWANLKPPKKKLARHLRRVEFETRVEGAEVEVWTSYRKRAGARVTCGSGRLQMHHRLTLVEWPLYERWEPLTGEVRYVKLSRRRRMNWETEKCLAHWEGIQCVLLGSAAEENIFDKSTAPSFFLLSVGLVKYSQRDDRSVSTESLNSTHSRDSKMYSHRIEIIDVRGSINRDTRTLFLAFLQQYENNRALKRDLSSEALRTISFEQRGQHPNKTEGSRLGRSKSYSESEQGHAYSNTMLSQIEGEVAGAAPEMSSSVSREKLAAEEACSDDDVKNWQWCITILNGQVSIQGPEQNGLLLITTGKCGVLGKEHQPVQRGGEFFSKFSWTCIVEYVQYFATVKEASDIEIPWLDQEIISTKRGRVDSSTQHLDPDSVESLISEDQEESLKGLVKEVLNKEGQTVTMLQRIVSRCSCIISFATFGSQPIEDDLDRNSTENLLQSQDQEYGAPELLTAFSLRHRRLEIATNSHQFNIIIDCVNNLLLRTEESKRSSTQRLVHAISLMTSGVEKARTTIAALQKETRGALFRIKELERKLYEAESRPLQRQLLEEKRKLNSNRDKLRMTISAYKEFMSRNGNIREEQLAQQSMNYETEVRRNEICIDKATWCLTEDCGQIPLLEVNIGDRSGFSYSRTIFSTSTAGEMDMNNRHFSSDHKIVFGSFCVKDLQNENAPRNILFPKQQGNTNKQGGDQYARKEFLRVNLRQNHNTVGGIIINRHFEVKVEPLVLRIEEAVRKEIQKFFVGDDRKEDDLGLNQTTDDNISIDPIDYAVKVKAESSKREKRKNISRKFNKGTFSSQSTLDVMAERNLQAFFKTIRIPEFTVLLSYRSKYFSVTDKELHFPPINLSDRRHTWRELLLVVKREIMKHSYTLIRKNKQNALSRLLHNTTAGIGSETNDEEISNLLVGRAADAEESLKSTSKLKTRLSMLKPRKLRAPPTHVPEQDVCVKEGTENPGEWESEEPTIEDTIGELMLVSRPSVTEAEEGDDTVFLVGQEEEEDEDEGG